MGIMLSAPDHLIVVCRPAGGGKGEAASLQQERIAACVEELEKLEVGSPAWTAVRQELAELAALRRKEMLLLDQAKGGFLARACARLRVHACMCVCYMPRHSLMYAQHVCLLRGRHEAGRVDLGAVRLCVCSNDIIT